MSGVLFLFIRVLHILIAASWIGSTVLTVLVLLPAIENAGASGAETLVSLGRKGLGPFFGILAGTTALTGFYLLWRFTGGFDPEVSGSHAGIAFSTGGLAGVIAVIIGGAVVGRSLERLVRTFEQLRTVPDGEAKTQLLQTASLLKKRIATYGMFVLACQIIALILMTLGHYI